MRFGFIKFAAMAALVFSQGVWATTTLKQVQISNGSQIDLLFDGKVQKSQIRTEFFNDIIQLSVTDVSVYPAKISSVNGGNLTKIFAYQYAPKLVRCRLTVKGKAESYKDNFEIKAGGKILTIRVNGATAVAQQTSVQATPGSADEKSPAVNVAAQDPEERALLSRVLASDTAAPHAPAAPADATTVASAKAIKDSISTGASAPINTENLPIHSSGTSKLGGAKPLPSPMKAFGKMAIVLGVFGLFAFLFKRFAQNKADARLGGVTEASHPGSNGMFGALGRIAKKGLSRNGKMIEVLSTHYLGPKKSIAVVRVAGRMLVLGVSNESINLITQLSGDEADPLNGVGGMDGLDLGGLGIGSPGQNQPGGKSMFSDLLNAESAKPAAYVGKAPAPRAAVAPKAAVASYGRSGAPLSMANEPSIAGTSNDSLSSVRAQIRNRLEGLKPL